MSAAPWAFRVPLIVLSVFQPLLYWTMASSPVRNGHPIQRRREKVSAVLLLLTVGCSYEWFLSDHIHWVALLLSLTIGGVITGVWFWRCDRSTYRVTLAAAVLLAIVSLWRSF
jgi:hypothetical protein